MLISANSFISISIPGQTHSSKQYFQNLEPVNPPTKIKKCYQNEQLIILNSFYNLLNIYEIIFGWLNPPPQSPVLLYSVHQRSYIFSTSYLTHN